MTGAWGGRIFVNAKWSGLLRLWRTATNCVIPGSFSASPRNTYPPYTEAWKSEHSADLATLAVEIAEWARTHWGLAFWLPILPALASPTRDHCERHQRNSYHHNHEHRKQRILLNKILGIDPATPAHASLPTSAIQSITPA